MKGITDLAKANRKPWAILNDWILLNSLLDSHNHVNPNGNKNCHDNNFAGRDIKDFAGQDVKESAMLSWTAAWQRVGQLGKEVDQKDKERTRNTDTTENFRNSHVINYQQSLNGCGQATHQGTPHAPNQSLKAPFQRILLW